MAGSEARAVWQRMANRCFVQEDAKRAPKLACCQSSSSSSKQVDTGPAGVADAPDNPAGRFMPINMSHLYSERPSDTKWLVHLQPNNGYQIGLTSQQINSVEAHMETLSGFVDSPCGNPPSDGTGGALVDGSKSNEVSHAVCRKKDPEVRKQNAEAVHFKTAQEFIELMDIREYEFIEIDPLGCLSSKTSDDTCFDPESPWIEGGKSEPWWRTTDKDDLASLVAQKSVSYMENCDLPPPHKKHTRAYPYTRSWDKTSDSKYQADYIPNLAAQGSSDSRRASVEQGRMPFGSGESFRCTATKKGISEIQELSKNDFCKAQLMEALRHSQTRAREAETTAKEAYAEKEHMLKLFFRQASQLFAYKQWFQMLQLEAIYFQIKNSHQPISTLFPVALPWVPLKGKKMRRNFQKASKGRRTYAFAFAWGLGLVGAGLLLGWTVGWMLPL